PEMIERARAEYPELEFVVGDGAHFAFGEPFDAVFSNAALHWISAAAHGDVAECVTRGLKPGGRFVAASGRKGSVAMITRSRGACGPRCIATAPGTPTTAVCASSPSR